MFPNQSFSYDYKSTWLNTRTPDSLPIIFQLQTSQMTHMFYYYLLVARCEVVRQ